jgi:hypothetical protein
MIKEAIEKIQDLVENAATDVLVKIHGLQYELTGRGYIPLMPPGPSLLKTKTLDGLISWLVCPEGPEWAAADYFLQVEDHGTVYLYKRKNEYEARHMIMRADFTEDVFPFGKYMMPEDFIIKVQTHFEETPEKAAIINMASKIRGKEVKTSEDNGIAQTVTMLNEVGRLEAKDVNPIFALRPRRTFPEAEQPESPFLFRVRKIEGEATLALFAADTGAWKIQAVKNIVEYLSNHTTVKTSDLKIVG